MMTFLHPPPSFVLQTISQMSSQESERGLGCLGFMHKTEAAHGCTHKNVNVHLLTQMFDQNSENYQYLTVCSSNPFKEKKIPLRVEVTFKQGF